MNATLETKISHAGAEMAARLDDLEQSLPPIPSKALAATRAGARRMNDIVASTARTVSERMANVGESAATSFKTAVGQTDVQTRRAASSVSTSARTAAGQTQSEARRAANAVSTSAKTAAGQTEAQVRRAADAVATGAKTAAGQVAAEARQTARAAADEIEGGLDDATLAMDPAELSSMSKSELYDKAQDLDIEGRSTMSKAELVSALQSA